jgi:hypothetical protein
MGHHDYIETKNKIFLWSVFENEIGNNNNISDFEKFIFQKKHITTNKFSSRLIMKFQKKIHIDDSKRYKSHNNIIPDRKISKLKEKIFQSNNQLINKVDNNKNEKDRITVIKVKTSKLWNINNINN